MGEYFSWVIAVHHAMKGQYFSWIFEVHFAKIRKIAIFLWFLAAYPANTGIIFRGYTQFTVQIQEQYLFFFVFRSPLCSHIGTIPVFRP